MNRSVLLPVCLVALVMAPSARAQTFPLQFAAARTYSFDNQMGARWLEIAHLNLDGRLDILTDVSYRLGNTQGSFGPQRLLGIMGSGLVTGDFDGDFRTDYVVSSDENVFLFRGDGMGSFVRTTLAVLEGATSGVALVDLDEDTSLDVVVIREDASPAIDRVTALYGDGAGGIASTTSFDIPVLSKRVLTADLDEDGHEDVVVLHQTSLSVLWGTGVRGTLGGPDTLPVLGSQSRDLRSADLDGDGHVDLVVSSPPRSELQIFYGVGDRSPVSSVSLPLPVSPTALGIGHLDAGSTLDVVVGGSNQLVVLLGEGGRSFRELGSFPSTGSSLSDLEIADMDRDGLNDVVVISDGRTYSNTRVSIHEGKGTGVLVARSDHAVERPRGIVAADFDEDGDLDVCTGHATADRATLLLGDGRGGLTPGGTLETPFAPFDGPRDHIQFGTIVVTGDFNDDGLADLAVGNIRSFSISVFLGQEGIDFDPPRVFFDVPPIPLRGLAVADLDADGCDDIVAASMCDTCPGPERGFEQGYVTTHLSNGDGTFTKIQTLYGGPPYSGTLPTPGDFDEDGNLDLLYGDGPLYVLFGDGAGHITRGPSILPRCDEPVVGDFNRDGHLDFAGTLFTRKIVIYLGNGNGGFGLHQQIPIDEYPVPPTVVDFDLDGNLDLVVPAGVIVPLRGEGGGSFTLEDSLGTTLHTYALAPGDFDGDGQTDLAVSSYDSDQPGFDAVSIIRNRSLDHIASRQGNVNALTGSVTDVLFVNGSTGNPLKRRLVVDRNAPFTVTLEQPPSRAMSAGTRYALYASVGVPTPSTTEEVPFGIGRTCIITPPNGGNPAATWNTLAHPRFFGEADYPSGLAPTTVFSLSQGVRMEITFTLQGFILDRQAPNGILATTNAVVVESR